VQTIGRAARNLHGKAILYGDKITRSMQAAIDETDRRRDKQRQFNKDNNIVPIGIHKSVTDVLQVAIPGAGWSSHSHKYSQTSNYSQVAETSETYKALSPIQLAKKLKQLEDAMYKHAKNLEFEQAAKIRDEIKALQDLALI
jgi:excinuclease ABC subunit B